VSWVCNPVALASCPQSAGTGGIDQLVDLAVGGALHYTMNATVTAAAGATVLNTASISVPAGFLDIETIDNTVSDNDPVVPDVILDDDFEGGSRVSVMLPAGATRD
jgi:hypothetical protein